MMVSPQAQPKLFSSDSCYSVYSPLSRDGISPFITQTSTAPTSLGESKFSPGLNSTSPNKFEFNKAGSASPHHFKLSSQGYPFPWVLSRPSTPPLLSVNAKSTAAATPLNEISAWSSSSSSSLSSSALSPTSPSEIQQQDSRPKPILPIMTSSPLVEHSAPTTPWEQAERRSKFAGSTPGAPGVAAFIPVHEDGNEKTTRSKKKFGLLNSGFSSLTQAREKRRSSASEEKPKDLDLTAEGGQGREGMVEGKYAD